MGLAWLVLCGCLHGAAAPDREPLLALFPQSAAPAADAGRSELEVCRQWRPWERNSQWHPEVNEQDVFHARLIHKSAVERCWELGIGRGGQLYSLVSSFGEALPPQTPTSRWMDEAWQMTTIYEQLLGRDLPARDQSCGNAFVHQSGIYTREKGSRPFYSPLLATDYDPARRAYAVLCWAQVPDASINRSGVLIYAQYRDLGEGVIEVNYIVFNFEREPLTNLSPWGGVRTSVFPEQVVSNLDGSYRFWTPYSYGSPDCRIDFDKTGGWSAVTRNAADPHSFALAVVFGRGLEPRGLLSGKPRYDTGNSRHGLRDYTVQATVFPLRVQPGSAHLVRMYFVIDTLASAAAKANAVARYAGYQPLEFQPAATPRVPLFACPQAAGPAVLTRTPPATGDQPVCRTYAWPVRGARPLFRIRDKQTGRDLVTTDPYAHCDREPFANPLPPAHPSYAKYQHRTLYRAFAGRTEWVELLGFVSTTREPGQTGLVQVPVAAGCFEPGECAAAADLFVPAGP